MTAQGFDNAKALVKKIYSNFQISKDETHVAVMVYGDARPELVFDFITHTDKPSMDSDLSRTQFPSDTSSFLGGALKIAKSKVFDSTSRPGAQKVLVILAAAASADSVAAPARAFRDRGVKIVLAAIGSASDEDQLKEVASVPYEEHVITVDPGCFDCSLSRVLQVVAQGEST